MSVALYPGVNPGLRHESPVEVDYTLNQTFTLLFSAMCLVAMGTCLVPGVDNDAGLIFLARTLLAVAIVLFVKEVVPTIRSGWGTWWAEIHEPSRVKAGVDEGRTAVLSLHPEYSRLVDAGWKTVEVRRRPIRPDTTHILVYTTRPVKKVTALAEVVAVHRGTPEELWARFGLRTFLVREEFDAYLAGRDEACVVELGAVHPLPMLDLAAACGVARPPQCVQYLHPDQAHRLSRSIPRRPA